MKINFLHRKGQTDNSERKKPVTIMVTSDLHFLSKRLFDDGQAFKELMEISDGRLIEYSEELLCAFVSRVNELKPDAVVIPGDLTFDGEKESLLDVKRILETVDRSVAVLIIPGNHDISNPFASRFTGKEASSAEPVSEAEFHELMNEFGPDHSIAKDPSSFSYVYQLTDDLRLIAVDVNTPADPGSLSEETMNFLKTQLQAAKKDRMHVITFSHQNVLAQSNLLFEGFVIRNRLIVEDVLKKYGVRLHLSGHSHLQHTAVSGSLSDLCTETLALDPLQFSIVTINKDRTDFDLKLGTLGIFEDEAKERFIRTMRRQVQIDLPENITEEEKESMTAFACRINNLYFSGRINDALKEELMNDPGLALWNQYASGSFWNRYIKSMLD